MLGPLLPFHCELAIPMVSTRHRWLCPRDDERAEYWTGQKQGKFTLHKGSNRQCPVRIEVTS